VANAMMAPRKESLVSFKCGLGIARFLPPDAVARAT